MKLGKKPTQDVQNEHLYKSRVYRSILETHAQIIKNIKSSSTIKPTIVDAQRVLKVFDELYQRINIFIYLDSEFVSKFLDISKGRLPKDIVKKMSEETKTLLAHQAEIEAKFKPYATLLDQSSFHYFRITNIKSQLRTSTAKSRRSTKRKRKRQRDCKR